MDSFNNNNRVGSGGGDRANNLKDGRPVTGGIKDSSASANNDNMAALHHSFRNSCHDKNELYPPSDTSAIIVITPPPTTTLTLTRTLT